MKAESAQKFRLCFRLLARIAKWGTTNVAYLLLEIKAMKWTRRTTFGCLVEKAKLREIEKLLIITFRLQAAFERKICFAMFTAQFSGQP